MAESTGQRGAQDDDAFIERAIKAGEKEVYEYKGKRYTTHPAATLFPLETGDRFAGLVESIRASGVHHPVLLLGNQIVDGRNRLRAALETGAEVTFIQISEDEDVCRRVLDENIHRRNLTPGQRGSLASQLRRMSIFLEQKKRIALRKAQVPADSGVADGEGERTKASPEASGTAGEAGGGAPAGGDDESSVMSALDGDSVLSRKAVADAVGVSESTVKRIDKVVETAPELEQEIAQGTLTVRDAESVSEEAPELRKQVVDDVRAGRAKSGAEAIRKRTGRAPKAQQRPKAASPAAGRSDGDAGDVGGMPPLPSVGGDGGGKQDAAQPPAAAVVGPRGSGNVLPASSLTPSLLMAGIRRGLGLIECDPCSSFDAQERVRAAEYFTPDNDGIQQAWRGVSYVFPPPQMVSRFASKLLGEMMAGRVPKAALLGSGNLSGEWQQMLLRSSRLTALVVETERTEYAVEGGKPVKAPEPMALYLFGVDRDALYDAFDPWGKVLAVVTR